MDCGLPGSSVRGILQARTPEWVVISASRGSSKPRDGTRVSCTAGRFFTMWATREAPNFLEKWFTELKPQSVTAPQEGTSTVHLSYLYAQCSPVLSYISDLYANNTKVRRHRLPDLSTHLCDKVCAFVWKINLHINHSLCMMEFWACKYECNSTTSIQRTSKRMFISLFIITVIKYFLWI